MVAPETRVDLSQVLVRARESRDESYARVVCQFPFAFYLERIRRLAFTGKGRVLDVGCGFGQWAAAHALLNRRVVALECHLGRLGIAQDLVCKAGLENVDFLLGDAVSLPFEDASFDAVFCYGVFMFLDRQRALQEFWRILKPGGELYICTNAAGWWLQLWLRNLVGDKTLRKAAYRAMTQGHRNGIPNSTSRKAAPALFKPSEWQRVETGHEGTLSRLPGNGHSLPCYPGSFLGLDAVIELLAVKRGAGSAGLPEAKRGADPKGTLQTLRRVVHETLSKTTYEYAMPLKEFPQPHHAADLVNNCFSDMIREAVGQARSVDRVAQLRWIYRQVTDHCQSPAERVRACVGFAQRHWFHHFAGQPMVAIDIPVFDPIAGVLLRFGRCGTAARFLVDLFECNGLPARLVIAGCHAFAEVLCDGRWLLADANLFPPGISPLDDHGDPVSLEQVSECPSLLDRCPSYVNYHHEYIEAFSREYPETMSTLERYLRAPLLPSAGYFGEEYFIGRPAGVLERLSKRGSPSEWDRDEHFGWLFGYERDTLQGPALPSLQRPGQVTGVYLERGNLCWNPAYLPEDGMSVCYRLIVRDVPRGWEYGAIPVGCRFETRGMEIVTDDTRISLDSVASFGNYLTVLTEVKEWQDKEVFYLPSNELSLEGVLQVRDGAL